MSLGIIVYMVLWSPVSNEMSDEELRCVIGFYYRERHVVKCGTLLRVRSSPRCVARHSYQDFIHMGMS